MRYKMFRSSWVVCVLSLAIALPHGAFVGAQAAGQTSAAPAQAKPAAPAAAKPAAPKPVATAAKPAAEPPPGTNADTGWPRTVALKTGTATWYQPQVESWVAQKNMVAWSAVAYQITG